MLEVLIPSMIPAAADGVRALINRFTGGAGAAPSNPDEAIRLMEADTARLAALAKIEGTGVTYLWVEAVRKLQRPVMGAAAVSAYVVAMHTDVEAGTVAELGDWVQAYFFYLFGERTYMHLSKAGRSG